ncbi:MAG: S9 family peptidase, partial [Gemmatimonadetes bacterium]|nr:S9 family peptidase [Gemmatimonadota bacterium]
MSRLIRALALGVLFMSHAAVAADEDPYLWLEEVEGEKALGWVEERSAQDTAEIKAHPDFEAIHQELLEIYN